MEDYLEAVLILHQKHGSVRGVDIAVHLGVTKPSVSRAVKELSKSGYIVKNTDGTLSLTDSGLQIATQIYEKHLFSPSSLSKQECRRTLRKGRLQAGTRYQ
ncbi:MAG: metal-dependent transcriptional regulator [Oscillospiraceae bacterium]